MDGRTSALLVLSLTLACCGCVTTHEKKVVTRFESEPAPTVVAQRLGDVLRTSLGGGRADNLETA